MQIVMKLISGNFVCNRLRSSSTFAANSFSSAVAANSNWQFQHQHQFISFNINISINLSSLAGAFFRIHQHE
jgi:hypothetical protein